MQRPQLWRPQLRHPRLQHPALRRARTVVAVLLVTLAGMWLGNAALGHVDAQVGPAQARFQASADLSGGVGVRVPPLGAIDLPSHQGPLRVSAEVRRLDAVAARQLVDDPALLTALPQQLTDDVQQALIRLVIVASLVAVAGAVLLGLLAFRSLHRALACGATAVGLIFVSAGVGAATLREDALEEPRYSGLLASAPSVIGSAEDIAGNFTRYGDQLSKLVGNVSRLYAAATTLPLLPESGTATKVLLVSDIHLNPAAWPVIRSTVQQYEIDIVVDAGDLTDHGSSLEDAFAAPISTLGVPYVFVRGNHDSTSTERAVAAQDGATVLQGAVVEVAGLRFLGSGDPRFTPDQSTRLPGEDENARVEAAADLLATTASDAAAAAEPVDIAVVHDPVGGRRLDGAVPLILSGHTHQREVSTLEGGSTLFVQGSTGGAGLRALEGEEPTEVDLSVLYIDSDTNRLRAYDDITLGGLGLATATVQRHVVDEPDTESAAVAPASPAPAGPVATSPSTAPGNGE